MSIPFNSSDELGPEEDLFAQEIARRGPKFGQRTRQAILENLANDRVWSKKAQRRIQPHHGSPSTVEASLRVRLLWETWYTEVGKNKNECPKVEDIERFILVLTDCIKPKIEGKGKLSLSTMQNILELVVDLFTFMFQEFPVTYGQRGNRRMESLLDQLVKEDKLIKGRWSKRPRFKFKTIHRIARCWIESALNQGCSSWDRRWMSLAAMVLQAACAARAGEVLLARGYTNYECVCWRNIRITLENSDHPTVQDLRVSVRLRFTKEYKDSRDVEDLTHTFEPLDTDQNAVCLVKILLVLALRLGQVDGTRAADVIKGASRDIWREVRWKYPDRPVIPQIRGRGSPSQVTPSTYGAYLQTLKHMARVAGVLETSDTQQRRTGTKRPREREVEERHEKSKRHVTGSTEATTTTPSPQPGSEVVLTCSMRGGDGDDDASDSDEGNDMEELNSEMQRLCERATRDIETGDDEAYAMTMSDLADQDDEDVLDYGSKEFVDFFAAIRDANEG